MGHWARIDDNNIVQDVVAITEDMLKTENYYGYDKSVWIKTSYNTRGGKHYAPNYDGQTYLVESENQSKAIRWTYAGIGMYYDSVRDIFYLPKPLIHINNKPMFIQAAKSMPKSKLNIFICNKKL